MTPDAAALPDSTRAHRLPTAGRTILTEPDAAPLAFVAEMYGLQMDQLTALLVDRGEPPDVAADSARELVSRWRAAGLAETGELSLGEPWVWATRRALQACGLRTSLVKPNAQGLRHTHAVTDVRLAIERTAVFREGGAAWRTERSILSQLEGRSEHVPDGEVHWPADNGLPWAGETWAIEVEISPKSVERTAGIMRVIVTRTGDWARFSPSDPVPGVAPRYARVVYACAPTTVRPVLNARAEVGSPLSARIDVYDLPESALRLNNPKRGWDS